jgi:hypothetical protein
LIGESTGHWKDGDRSTVINSVNRIRLIDGKKLKLEESIENVKATGPQGTEASEYHRKFEIRERPPDADGSIFYLSHYGFPEPDFADLEPAPKLHRFAWFFILLLAGVTLLVIARHARPQNGYCSLTVRMLICRLSAIGGRLSAISQRPPESELC